jgi:hypothetical protein
MYSVNISNIDTLNPQITGLPEEERIKIIFLGELNNRLGEICAIAIHEDDWEKFKGRSGAPVGTDEDIKNMWIVFGKLNNLKAFEVTTGCWIKESGKEKKPHWFFRKEISKTEEVCVSSSEGIYSFSTCGITFMIDLIKNL